MALISVIVPVYKVESYLSRCVDSIIGQSFRDFELILIDDGSPDESGRICDDYAASDCRICVIHQRNGGLSAARNAGIVWAIENSNSEWVAFIDSDDWVHPQYLEYLYKAATENHVQIRVCNFLETERTVPVQERFYKAELWNWSELLIENNLRAVVAWNKLYRKQLFSGLRYPPGKIHEDEFITYKLLHRAGTVAYLPEVLHYYFRNADGITGDRFSIRRLDCADALQERIHYVRKLKKDELTEFCVCQFLDYCWRMLPILRSADWIPSDIRSKKEKEIKIKIQRTLAFYGLRYAPPWKKGQYYDYAFPALYHTARSGFRSIKKLIKRRQAKK